MARKRVNEIKQKKIHPQRTDVRSNAREVFKEAAAASDNYHNQFESPLLFYIAILLALTLLIQDYAIVALSWTYVGLRYIHSFIHITYNLVLHRFAVFVLSSVALFALWIRLGWIIIW